MFKKILIPLDGSALAERAVDPALQLAQCSGGEAILLRVAVMETLLVADPATLGGYDVLWPEQALERSRAEARRYLEGVAQARRADCVALRVMIAEGDVPGGIVDTAAEQAADLIVMSTHGHSGFTRWMLGSVTEKVLRSASCPVWVMRDGSAPSSGLITLDGSALAELVIEPALAIVAAFNAPVTLLRAVPDVTAWDVNYMESIETGLGRRLIDLWTEEAEVYLSRQGAALRKRGFEVQTAVVHGPAAERILAFAEEHRIDLICMATHGRTGLRRWAYGSVTEKVLRGAHGSLLVVRPSTHVD